LRAERARLRAARAFSTRVPGLEVIRRKTPAVFADEDPSLTWFEEFSEAILPDDFLTKCKMDKERMTTLVQNMWELESLVRALDAIETIASAAGLSREYVKTFFSFEDLANANEHHQGQWQ